ncbi:MAG: hypothetical protein ACK4WM_06050 [Thermoflexales bacterium]
MSRSPSTLALVLALVLGACAPIRPLYKIALVAPFEGRWRQVGYDVFPAFRLALRDHARKAKGARVVVSFVAYTDDADPVKAAQVAQQVAADPEVLVVIGHFLITTTLAALAVYEQAGLPMLAPHVPADQLPARPWLFRLGPSLSEAPRHNVAQPCYPALQSSTFGTCHSDAPPLESSLRAQTTLVGFTDISLGTPPTPRAIVGWDAAQVALAAIDLAAAEGRPSRAKVAAALRQVRYDGLLGVISFDDQQRWRAAPLWRWSTTSHP